jgi:hypothetical protein
MTYKLLQVALHCYQSVVVAELHSLLFSIDYHIYVCDI